MIFTFLRRLVRKVYNLWLYLNIYIELLLLFFYIHFELLHYLNLSFHYDLIHYYLHHFINFFLLKVYLLLKFIFPFKILILDFL